MGLCALLTGCSEAYYDAPASPANDTEADLRITFEDNLGFPYRLRALIVSLDGARIYAQRFDPERSDRPAEIAQLSEIAEGEHTLELRALTSYSATRLDADEGCNIDLRIARTFQLATQHPAKVHLNLYTKGNVTLPFARRVKARVAVQGANDVDESSTATTNTASEICRDDAPLAPNDDRPLFEERFTEPYGLSPSLFAD